MSNVLILHLTLLTTIPRKDLYIFQGMMKKILIRFLVALLALIILMMIIAPGIVKRYAIKNSPELIGRQINMDRLRLNYLTGMIKITDFVMYEQDNSTSFIAFDTLIVNLEPYQFFIDDFVMEQFYLKGLKVNIILDDSTFNFDDLVAYHTPSEDTTPQDTATSEPFQFHLSNIELKNAEIVFEDKNIDKTTDLKDISFFIPYIGWNQEEKSEAGLRFSFKDEGYFESSINVDPIGGEFDAKITISMLHLDAFREYAAEYININEVNGTFNSQFDIIGNINEPEKSILTGHIEVLDFNMKDMEDKEFLAIDNLACNLKSIDSYNSSFVIDSLILTRPYAYFELDTNTNNFFEIFEISAEVEDSVKIAENITDTISGGAVDSLFYAVNHVSIRQGVIDYTDMLTGEPFEYYLSEINLESDSIKSSSDWIDLYASMLLNKRGTLKAEVGFNPANPADIVLNYVVEDFMLSDLNIYSRFYMGFPIVYGDMYYKSETEILSNQLTSENKLIMTNVELGDKSGGLYDLPVKFALFLLKDRDGVITLDVPVRGDLNDPTVKVGKIIWNTFKNLIVKIAASPFDALSRLLGVDPKDIKSIDYQYSDTTLTAERQKQLDLLLELEQKKEGLEIELVYFNDIEKEKEAIAIAQAGKMFAEETSGNYQEKEKEFTQFLQAKLGVDTLDVRTACMQLADRVALDSLVNFYSRVRKEQIEHYLTSLNDSTLIFTSVSNPDAPKNAGSLPMFEVKYSMMREAEKKPEE